MLLHAQEDLDFVNERNVYVSKKVKAMKYNKSNICFCQREIVLFLLVVLSVLFFAGHQTIAQTVFPTGTTIYMPDKAFSS